MQDTTRKHVFFTTHVCYFQYTRVYLKNRSIEITLLLIVGYNNNNNNSPVKFRDVSIGSVNTLTNGETCIVHRKLV